MATPLLEKTAELIEEILWNYPISIKESDRPREFHHLLHLCHMYFRPSRNYDFDALQLQLNHDVQPLFNGWRPAVQYHKVGVRFKKREFDKYDPHSLLDLRLYGTMIEIPVLRIDENIDDLFRNLIALEQSSTQFGNDITSYVFFMSQLLRSSTDVALFVREGIIENCLRTNEEVLDIIIELSEGLVFDFSGSYYLKSIYLSLEAYYQSRMNSWKGWFRRIVSAIGGSV